MERHGNGTNQMHENGMARYFILRSARPRSAPRGPTIALGLTPTIADRVLSSSHHATASCGFLSIAKFLLEAGADVAAVNNDGELAIDISESDEMEDLLQKEIDSRSINCEEARNLEEQCMLNDASGSRGKAKLLIIDHVIAGAKAAKCLRDASRSRE